MTDSYIRRFSPNKWHIISVLCAVISVLLLVSGAHRAFRVMGRLDPTGLAHEGTVHENDSILTNLYPVRARLKEAANDSVLSCGTAENQKYEVLVVKDVFKYRYAAVKKDSDEYDMLMNGEPVTAYFSYKYSDMFRDRIMEMGLYFDEDTVIPQEDCLALGLIVVDREKELLSFLWFFPFLALALILFRIGGSPFFYFSENDNQHSGG